ncbi:MAG: type II toxin-antitoxin system RelE/ParE family toxin [Candidatus Thiodiazotropha endolucinida]|nr:type II toxin-antitoxin system RelE/ParE family toxin [Candidatus Thiodiazotropha taylori]MCG8100716.1 type II toxin-antitoxin system RelE/ParE family toxin [Candidatus Thiodiazotropha taylori]MCW4293648.1 type II toxin-antitoxin system RelE/ParE family toxin [Candidatus Thiodiazotropha taylori]MCW4319279.1 type II toxin-antitoxin system RelE/ParE family toxin [Candidatus Thiodiazotropha taylori]
MASHQLVIAPAAKNDLKEIYQYGQRQWGRAQTDRYLSTLKNQFWLLTQQLLMGIERPELLPDTRSLPVESHTLFYRVTANKVEIIRVLHGRQDPQRQMK